MSEVRHEKIVRGRLPRPKRKPIPDSVTGVESFLEWWWNTGTSIDVPFDDSVYADGRVNGTVLFRQPPYQVQMFVFAPDSVIPEHIHPNVDSFEVYLSGDIVFSVEGSEVTPSFLSQRAGKDGRHVLYGHTIRIHPDTWHSGVTGPKGGVFLSVQKWLNGVSPEFIGHDWVARDSSELRHNYKLLAE